MEWLDALNTILATIGLRFIVPIVVTMGIIYILRKLDVQWQSEAQAVPLPILEGPRCCDVKNCSSENQENCIALKSSEPCWQVFRQANKGLLKEECLACSYFTNATLAVSIGD